MANIQGLVEGGKDFAVGIACRFKVAAIALVGRIISVFSGSLSAESLSPSSSSLPFSVTLSLSLSLSRFSFRSLSPVIYTFLSLLTSSTEV